MGKHFYIHIPFCIQKCQYCSFYSERPESEEVFADYKNAVLNEIKMITRNDKYVQGYDLDDDIDTIYVGGGTPSVMPASYLVEMIEGIRDYFGVDINNPERTEITVEVNPYTADSDKLEALREGGFNRISIGVQSLNDDTLKVLGRLHDSSMAIKAIKNAREAGFTNISADLIIGVPGQKLEDVLSDTRELISLGVTHLSSYSLSIEEGTPFADKYKKLYEFVDEDEERQMYHGLRDTLRKAGFDDYEISNSSLPGFESHHNNCYWRGSEYYAFGAGSHGYSGSLRFAHDDDYHKYIEAMKNPDILPRELVRIEEFLSTEDKMREYMMLSFRTKSGVDLDFFYRKFGKNADKYFSNELYNLQTKGLVKRVGRHYCYTQKGLNFANIIFEEFV